MVALLPYANQYFNCIIWQTINIRTAEIKWLSFTVFMNDMHLNYQLFSFFLVELKLTVKQILRIVQTLSL